MAIISADFLPFVTDLATATGMRVKQVAPTRLEKVAVDVVSRRLARATGRADLVKLRAGQKKRYIVSPLLHQQSAAPSVRASLLSLHDTLKEAIVRSEHEDGPKVLKLSALEAAVLKERFGNLLVEEDIQYRLPRTPLLGAIEPISVSKSVARTLTVQVQGNGAPVAEARVVLLSDAAKLKGYEGFTGVNGTLTVSIRKSDTRFEKVVVLPRAGFWSRVRENVKISSPLVITLSPLPLNGFDWGHQATEAGARGNHLGRGVKIAIIDTGIGIHPSLKVAGGKNFIEGEAAADCSNDLEGHGTHCAGVVAALSREASVWGYAPECSLYALRVFGGADGGGYASDIGDAIEWAVNEGCDIVSMSLGSDTPSSYIRMKIERATDVGVLCVAAAGNEGGPVSYPAKFRNVVGVSAIGQLKTYPKDSIHRDAESSIRSSDGKYYLASFSNTGEEIDICAPGVAITSTLPASAFGAWDGTSMACPHATGIAALALETAANIKGATRDAARMGMLLDRLLSTCVDLGMGRIHQGSGLPHVSKL